MTLHLHGIGHFHPENEITNSFLESLDIGTNEEWIMDRVGIRSRRTCLSLDYIRETRNQDVRAAVEAAEISNAEMGERAVRMAVERAGISLSDVGMLTSGSSAPDYTCPAEASTVAVRLGLEVPVLDVNSACTSLFAQIWMLSLMRPEALPPYVVIVAPEQLTKTVDYSDRAASVLWGDGAAAAVISLTEPGRAEIPTSRLVSSPAGWDRVIVPRQGHFDQDGRKVQMFAIRKTCESVDVLKAEFDEPERRFHFIGHQANLRMLENVCRRCDIESDRHHYNVDWYGNTAAASAASVVSMNWDKWGARDDIAMAGVGGGLTWSSYLIRFSERAGVAA